MKPSLLHRISVALAVIAAAGFPLAYAAAQAPTEESVTTLAALHANTTSAADSFTGAFNGLPKSGNLSPLPITSLLPSGDKTRYIAHIVPWFTLRCNVVGPNCPHFNSGYEQNDAKQVARQMADMRRRGFSILFVDWYGPSGHRDEDEVAQKIMHEAERLKRNGIDFTFAVQADKGIVRRCDKDKQCSTQMMIEALTYAYKTYESSPAYLHWNSRPVVSFFITSDALVPLDWDEIHAKVPGNPLFVFQKAESFTHPYSGGAYAWNSSTGPSDMGFTYLDGFYKVASTIDKDRQMIIGSAYAGFDDRLASWGKHKIIARQCGLTWLDTMKESLNYEKATGSPLPFLQVMTWNDYEEGTAMEMGIDNCVAGILGAVKNKHLTWSVAFGKDNQGYTGSEETIAYFRVFANLTGDHVKEIARVPATSPHDVDLTPFHLTSGRKLYIQAVGKTQILNHLSDAIVIP